ELVGICSPPMSTMRLPCARYRFRSLSCHMERPRPTSGLLNPTTLAAWWLGICADTITPPSPERSGPVAALLSRLLHHFNTSKGKPDRPGLANNVDCGR